jgi:hypothetical protein
MISRGVYPFILICRVDVITSQSDERILDNGISFDVANDNAKDRTSRIWTLFDYVFLETGISLFGYAG